MTGLIIEEKSGGNDRTPPPARKQIQGYLSVATHCNGQRGGGDADLKKPFKEMLKTHLTKRIIEFAGPEYKMPVNIKLYDGTTGPEDHLSRFASEANSEEWPMPANGLVERVNKSLMEGIKTRLGRDRARYVHELPNVLWAHRFSLKQRNGETLFSLTYDSEAVIPAEIGMPTHRTVIIWENKNEEELRLNLDLLPERMEVVAIREAMYK
nr:reverse transcriptase domain-containing protein [Tanacetum cinerariifolium]